MNRVKAAFFSFVEEQPGDDSAYLRWHLLDHLPEQYQLPGIVLGMRYAADGDYRAASLAAEGRWANVASMVNYLVGEPVQQTHDGFMELGRTLIEVGRFPEVRPSLQLRMPALLSWYAAPRVLVSAEVVPYRPHRGVAVLVEEPTDDAVGLTAWKQWLHTHHYPGLLELPGVAGAWCYGRSTRWDLPERTLGSPQFTTVVYLDDDPLAAMEMLTPLLEQRWQSGDVRPLFAGPMRVMVDWEAWR